MEAEPAAAFTEEPAVKKSKLEGPMLAFVTKHAPLPAKIASERKAVLTSCHTRTAAGPKSTGCGPSSKKQGSRKNDVNRSSMQKRVDEHPGHGLKICSGQLYCGTCGHNISSAKQGCDKHVETDKHKDNLKNAEFRNANTVALGEALEAYSGVVKAEHGEHAQIVGLAKVNKEVQISRAECLEETLNP